MNNRNKNIGILLLAERTRQQMSVAELAVKSGYTREFIFAVELGNAERLSFDNLKAICKALGVKAGRVIYKAGIMTHADHIGDPLSNELEKQIGAIADFVTTLDEKRFEHLYYTEGDGSLTWLVRQNCRSFETVASSGMEFAGLLGVPYGNIGYFEILNSSRYQYYGCYYAKVDVKDIPDWTTVTDLEMSEILE